MVGFTLTITGDYAIIQMKYVSKCFETYHNITLWR